MKRKLTDENIIAIYVSGVHQKSLAFKYGVSQCMVSLIKSRKIWSEVTKGILMNAEIKVKQKSKSTRLKPEVIVAILRSSGSQKDIAERFNVSQTTVSRIQNGKVHRSITNGRRVSQSIHDITLERKDH